jgi:hypothetical protein
MTTLTIVGIDWSKENDVIIRTLIGEEDNVGSVEEALHYLNMIGEVD